MAQQRKSVSIQMIADRCGVSTATVSRVLNSDARVAEATRKRIVEAMAECGYQPPAPPVSRIKKVGLIVDTQINDYYRALMIHLHDALLDQGLQTITASLGYRKEALPTILRTIYDSNVCGVILITCDYLSISPILNRRLPHVWIDCNDPPDQTEDICQVQSDQYVSGVLAAQELYRKGCRKPIILTGSFLSHRTKERFQGFRSEFEKHGVTVGEDRIIQTPRVRDALDESKQSIRYLIGSGYAFDGVFATSDWRALDACVVLSELGIRVPEDVRIIGYDGVSAACRAALNITCVQQDTLRIAQTACNLLCAQLDGQPIPQRRVIIPTSILPGQTL